MHKSTEKESTIVQGDRRVAHLFIPRNIKVDPVTGCWFSLRRDGDERRARTRKGYVQVSFEGVLLGLHRVSKIFHDGPIPEGMVLDHLRAPFGTCSGGEYGCMAPHHLEAVTERENQRRGAVHSCHKRGHEWDEANLTPYSDGKGNKYLRCRICLLAVKREGYHRRKANKAA